MVRVTGSDTPDGRPHMGSKGFAKKVASLLSEVGCDGDFLMCHIGTGRFNPLAGGDLPDDFWVVFPAGRSPEYISLNYRESLHTTTILVWPLDSSVDLEPIRQKLSDLPNACLYVGNGKARLPLENQKVKNEEEVDFCALLTAVACHEQVFWTLDELGELIVGCKDTEGLPNGTAEAFKHTYFRKMSDGRYGVNSAFWDRSCALADTVPVQVQRDIMGLAAKLIRKIQVAASGASLIVDRRLAQAERLERIAQRYDDDSQGLLERIEDLRAQLAGLETDLQTKRARQRLANERMNNRLATAHDEGELLRMLKSAVRHELPQAVMEHNPDEFKSLL